MSTRRRREVEVFGLSFLDVISCGFGAIVLLLGIVAVLVFEMPTLHLVLSGAFMLFSSAIILFQTGQIINGGERNYIIATITLYASIYNIFISLLHILMTFSGDD